jgi:uncharacterized protein (UPF0335 family)
MKTKEISLIYKLTPTEVISPSEIDIQRKEEWIKQSQATVESEWQPKMIKVTYKLFDPAIEDQRRFFEGACVKFYAIQNMDLKEGEPSSGMLKEYREYILDEMLGYDHKAVTKIIRMRKSTSDFKDVQTWNNFLKTLEETLFESAGYRFPDSEHFWELVKKHGYYEADRIVLNELQTWLTKKGV